jgi:adenosylhomocysteine nucleosidase
MRIALMSAMPEEIDMLLPEMGADVETIDRGKRTYYLGQLAGHEVVAVFSRWGKVAASATVTNLITEFGVEALLFSGVAGALAPGVKIGDIVVGENFLQHDLDARPLVPQFEAPLLGVARFQADPNLTRLLETSAARFASEDLAGSVGADVVERFKLHAPSVRRGLIVSGDRFVGSHADAQSLRALVGEALCVEMEGAAVAQVCYEYGVPFGVLRVMSDSADESASVDFLAFTKDVARNYSHGVILKVLAQL